MEELGGETVSAYDYIPFLHLSGDVLSGPQSVMQRIHQKDGKRGEREAGVRTFVSSIGTVLFALKILPFF
jgi:hypothetical protein